MLPYFIWPVLIAPFFLGTVQLSNFKITTIFNNMWATLAHYSGLWFLIVFWALSIIGYVMRCVGNQFGRITARLIVEGTILCILLGAILVLQKVSPYELWRQIIAYFPFFFIGVYLSRFQFLQRIACDKRFYTLCWIIFLISASQFDGSNRIYRIIGGLTSIPIFFYLSQTLMLPGPIKKFLITLGKYSLAIYIVHWYFLSVCINTPILSNLSQWWIGFLSTVFASGIATACVLFAKLIETIPLLNFLLFGKKISRNIS